MTTTADLPAEYAALGAQILARIDAQRAAITASDYRRTVTLRRDNLEVTLTIAPADCGTTWEINGTGIEYGYGGRHRAGDTRSHFRADLDDAKACANRWAASLTAKGYRITRTTR